MITTLKTEINVKEICEGFVYNKIEGKGQSVCEAQNSLNSIQYKIDK